MSNKPFHFGLKVCFDLKKDLHPNIAKVPHFLQNNSISESFPAISLASKAMDIVIATSHFLLKKASMY